jgi:hypothetical protein
MVNDITPLDGLKESVLKEMEKEFEAVFTPAN